MRWGALILLFLLAGAYWSYSIDLECHLNGYAECLSEHSDDATGCAAPSVQKAPNQPILCPLVAIVVLPSHMAFQQPPELCLWASQQWWPPDPDYVKQPGPPRAPPASLS